MHAYKVGHGLAIGTANGDVERGHEGLHVRRGDRTGKDCRSCHARAAVAFPMDQTSVLSVVTADLIHPSGWTRWRSTVPLLPDGPITATATNRPDPHCGVGSAAPAAGRPPAVCSRCSTRSARWDPPPHQGQAGTAELGSPNDAHSTPDNFSLRPA